VVKTFNKLVTIICISILFVSCIGCASKPNSQEANKQVATVQRGNLTVSVSVDGNLVMPQAFDLLFGAPGDVKDVLVEEGDFVREGTILARLDDTTQKLDVESSNNSVQTVLSNLYEVVPLLPQFPSQLYASTTTPETTTSWEHVLLPSPPNPTNVYGETPTTVTTDVTTTTAIPNTLYSAVSYPFYYPNATALSSFKWAQDEVSRARELFQTDNYTAATSELYVALSDLESCIKILEDTINNPKSGLGNTAPFVPTDLLGITYFQIQQEQSFESVYIVQLRSAVDLIRQGQADIETVRGLTAEGKYEEASQMFDTLLKRVNDIGKVVINNINVIKAHNYTTVYGEDISLYFYGAAEEKLNAALKGIEKDGLDSSELRDNLRIAQHYMQICNSILGSNHYVLQHGLSLKNEQQYNVDLAKALVALGNSKDNFLKTAILAPFDGTVVSVGVKKNDVLSAIDYASKVAVQLVDTSQIKFQGQVDEIDILKIKNGQKATISVDAVPNKTFTGTVSFISPYGTADTNNVVKFPVTIKLDPTDVALKGSLTATADISIYSVENVLLVPLSAVTTTSAGSFVTIVNEATGQQEKRQVTIGNKNLQFAEVLSGLKEGDKVTVEEKVISAPVVTGFPQRSGGPPPSR
jgi:multidrug efflux pump subunit AcrA (membrane-fusion protein)